MLERIKISRDRCETSWYSQECVKGEATVGKVLTILHTTPVTVKILTDIAREVLPEDVVLRNVVDDSLLNDTRKAGYLTKDVTRRLVTYVQLAEYHGSDCVLLSCSSVSPAVDVAREVVNIPVLKIDEPMAEEAVRKGSHIAVLATVSTTLKPTSELIVKAGRKAGIDVNVETFLCDDVFDALSRGDIDRHNRLLMSHIVNVAGSFDVVVLAQASMTNIYPELPEEIKPRVLTSPRLGLARAAEVLT